jgi:hypothetical protein
MAASLKSLATIRETIASIEAEIRAIDNSGLTEADVADRVKSFIATLAARFDESYIGMAFTHPNGIVTTTDLINACAPDGGHPGDESLVLEAWLRPELLEQKLLNAAAPYVQTGKTALPLDQRPALLRKLDARLADLCQEEEDMIVELQANGHEVFRRGNVDPLVVLGI